MKKPVRHWRGRGSWQISAKVPDGLANRLLHQSSSIKFVFAWSDLRTSSAGPKDKSGTQRRGDSTALHNPPELLDSAPRVSRRDKTDVSTNVYPRCHCRSCRDTCSLFSLATLEAHRLTQIFTD